MLKAIYPQVKAADPEANVLVGSLMLDCDPENQTGLDCHSTRFFEGILTHGGGPFFDGVAFQAYDFYGGELGKYANTNWDSTWDTTGPVHIAKARFLKTVLAAYGLADQRPLFSEGAIIGFPFGECGNGDFEDTKAYYVASSYAAAITEGISANIWHSLYGWRCSGLIDPDLAPKPAFDAYQFARDTLQDAQGLGAIIPEEVGGNTGVMGYKFDQGGDRIWVLWSLDGAVHNVTLEPGIPDAVYDVFGNAESPAATTMVDLVPRYLVWNP
jgi:hypothetical protein